MCIEFTEVTDYCYFFVKFCSPFVVYTAEQSSIFEIHVGMHIPG